MCQRDEAGTLRVMGTNSENPTYSKESTMARSFNLKQNRGPKGRIIAVLAISAITLFTGTVCGYASAKTGAIKTAVADTASLSAYGPSHLKGPLV